MENSIARMRPELVCEWSERNLPFTPDIIPYGSNKRYWWKGKCGHEWETSPKARSSGEKCPICSGARVVKGINDLKSIRPDLAKEWSKKNILKPTEVSIGSHKKILWHGQCGHEWEAVVKNRVQGAGCPYCSHNIVLSGYNDLASRFPDIALEWDYEKNYPLTPDKVTAFKNKKVWWRCKEGHEWNTLISTRAGGSQCPYCSGIQILKGFNDLQTTHPELALEWSERNGSITPDTVNEKSIKNVWWKCRTCGNEWKSVIKSRVNGSSCPVCAERALLKGYNDLQTTDPDIASEWDYDKNTFTPTEATRNTYKRAWWKCEYGHSWNAKISERTIDKINCKECEHEFQSVLLQLLVLYYCKIAGLNAAIMSDKAIGIKVETTIPELRLIIEQYDKLPGNINRRAVKEFICKKNGIAYTEVATNSTIELAEKVKEIFRNNHIFIPTKTEQDIQICRSNFFQWKNRQKENGCQ